MKLLVAMLTRITLFYIVIAYYLQCTKACSWCTLQCVVSVGHTMEQQGIDMYPPQTTAHSVQYAIYC